MRTRYRLFLESGERAASRNFCSDKQGWQPGDEIIAGGRTFKILEVHTEGRSEEDEVPILIFRPMQ